MRLKNFTRMNSWPVNLWMLFLCVFYLPKNARAEINSGPNGIKPSQSITIRGTVTSASDNFGIPGANVLIKGTSDGTVTDTEGAFRMEIPSPNTIL